MDFFAPLLARIGGPKRLAVLLVGIGAAALVLGVSRWASQPNWVPAYTGVPLETVSQLTAKLDQAGVAYRLERGGGDIMVAENDLATARVTLAKGGIPGAGRPGLELFDQPSWGMTDFTQRINYRRALEGELERTIGKMTGIETAQVHLVMHETDSFGSAQQPSEASVVLKLRGEPTDDVVQGIMHLVSSSVDGLTSDHVTIVDNSGRLLSQADEPNSTEGLTNRELVLQRQIEESLRAKAEDILKQIVGPTGLRVQVSAAMNFDRIERTTSSVDPDKQAVSAEQKNQGAPVAASGGSANQSATLYDNTKINESFVAAPGSIKRLTVAVLVGNTLTGTGAKQTSVARTAQELANIETLVRNAVGADSARGDVVKVVNVAFTAPVAAPAPEPVTRDIVATVEKLQRPTFGLLGLALAFVIAFLAIKAIGRTSQSLPALMALPLPNSSMSQALPPPMPMRTGSGIRDRVTSSIEGQPDAAARVVRAWLKEG